MNGHGHDFGHEFVSESVSEADSDTDTRFFRTSDTDTDMGRVMTSDTNILRTYFGHACPLLSDSDRGPLYLQKIK